MARRKKIRKYSNFTTGNSDFDTYKKGAMVGAVLGGITVLVLNKWFILFTFVGSFFGGYINYQIQKDDSNTMSLKKFTKEDTSTNTKTENDGDDD